MARVRPIAVLFGFPPGSFTTVLNTDIAGSPTLSDSGLVVVTVESTYYINGAALDPIGNGTPAHVVLDISSSGPAPLLSSQPANYYDDVFALLNDGQLGLGVNPPYDPSELPHPAGFTLGADPFVNVSDVADAAGESLGSLTSVAFPASFGAGETWGALVEVNSTTVTKGPSKNNPCASGGVASPPAARRKLDGVRPRLHFRQPTGGAPRRPLAIELFLHGP